MSLGVDAVDRLANLFAPETQFGLVVLPQFAEECVEQESYVHLPRWN